jgi:hypothetical protein
MALVELVRPQNNHQISVVPVIMKCYRFKNNPSLAIAPYLVEFRVSLQDFRDFITALEDKLMDIKDKNLPRVLRLSKDCGYQAQSMNLSGHRRSA